MDNTNLEAALLSAKDYRSFLKKAFVIQKKQNPKFSYASFARKAGLASKSFPRDVSLGRRGLSLTTAASFSGALGLSADFKSVFELLVAKDEKSVRPHDCSEQMIQNRIEKLKARIARKKERSCNSQKISFDQFKYWFEIYAALGAANAGASLEQIVSRTRMKKTLCESALKSMVDRGACTYRDGFYRPGSLNPMFEGLGKDPAFQSWFLHCNELARVEAAGKFSSEQALFLGSALSMKSHRLPEFKRKLRELCLQFIEDTEDSEGDRVVHLVAALF